MINTLHETQLGKPVTYNSHYDPTLLFPIKRSEQRAAFNLNALPFVGHDIWNAYELSWLNEKGKPCVAIAEFIVPCESTYLIESKSFKLYLNSFNNTKFADAKLVQDTLMHDLSTATGGIVKVNLRSVEQVSTVMPHFEGVCLDDLDVTIEQYTLKPDYLSTEMLDVSETLYSNLLKSNCPVTGQPDWASIQIQYTGKKIDRARLLQYLISFRNHEEFHEQCVERAFVDIMHYCQPEKLFVAARYTRRGGLDINPFRANYAIEIDNVRLWRQ